MTTLGGKGPLAITLMWLFTVISALFVVLRVYTRVYIVRRFGADDIFYTLSWVFLLLYTIFINIAAMYGFGQHLQSLPTIEDSVNAVYIEMISQTFAVLGMAVAKVSLGVFLLRIVVLFWQKAILWFAIVSIMVMSVLTDVAFWLQCIPSTAIYDPRVKGSCHLQVEGFAIALGSWCAAEDFFLAVFPWCFIWGLQMKRKEKLTIIGGLSLGVFAGICGIFRTISLTGFSTSDYTYGTFNLIIWSGAELCITLICIGIPVLRPLYKEGMKCWSSSSYPNRREEVYCYRMNNIRPRNTRDNDSEEQILGPRTKDGIQTTTEVAVTYTRGD